MPLKIIRASEPIKVERINLDARALAGELNAAAAALAGGRT